ncbi:hypothetical protein BB934_16840 [Microvirga ossetica]|uniref:Peptidase M10 serralysin C-terminal domain-containing protein n=1 Tax=Microvirga ossetica TaxID=1882682 RepID=A0A1B2EI80_9HYPH|nr:hypothetical protein BB934_16840 [Microvirga ossetica]
MLGTANADSAWGWGGNDSINGGAGNDSINGGVGNDILDGGLGNDILSGDLGNDTLMGAGGSDTLDGGEGDDIAVFSGNRADYTVSETQEGLLVTHLSTKGVQVISDVEFYQFAGATLSRAQFIASEPPVVVKPEPPVVQPEPPVVTPPVTVETTTSTTLAEGSLNLVAGGSSNISLTGNALNNSITGNVGKNTINGGAGADKVNGGSGNDTLYGGSGKDAFLFTTKLGTSSTDRKVNFDTVKDFNVKDDSLYLDNAIFKKLGKKGSEQNPVKLDKKFFTVGDKAKDKDDYVIYNKKTGVLSYDADGSGKGQAVEFALLTNKPTLKVDDFFVI